jgi:two-component system, NtrC family, sensor kinase
MVKDKTQGEAPKSILLEKHYKDLKRKHIVRLSLMYLLPLIILIFYFQFQYSNLLSDSRAMHLQSIAENQANLLDLFLKERVVNLINLIDSPNFKIPPDDATLEGYLESLKTDSKAFTDIDFFNSYGIEIAYAGPLKRKGYNDYSKEIWFINLKKAEQRYIITDVYLGFRKEPHFTIAVKRNLGDSIVVLRATLGPAYMYRYMTSIEGLSDVYVSLVNVKGDYQLVSQRLGSVLDKSPILPPRSEKIGTGEVKVNRKNVDYAFSWLNEVNWVVVVRNSLVDESGVFFGVDINILIFSIIIVAILVLIIFARAKKMALLEREKEIVRSQLEHASKLASVGELAAGIAHEINNPLAIITSEIGLIKDKMNPEFGYSGKSCEGIDDHLENMREAAYRCRDITRKLLSFVRVDDVLMKEYSINDILDDLIDGFFEREFAVSNIVIIKDYDPDLPRIITDSNQLRQVILNLVNNASDAITPPGKITITTRHDDDFIKIEVSDTGKGIKEEEISKLFLPFYTTKETGKGTGLGLSVSYSIIKNFGGNIEVESIPGKGSTFTVILPINK